MNDQKEKAKQFTSLHVKGDPVILFNIWDAGSAKAVEAAGAKAIATGSWSVAAAYGVTDGEELPLDLAIANLERITAAVSLPVTLDFEGGYAAESEGLEQNVARVISNGGIGINFEDQVVGGQGLYPVGEQSARINAVRRLADARDLPLFINARTDVFLKNGPADHAACLEEAIGRGMAYAEAGASGLFVPGLKDPKLIAEVCKRSPLPVNIMVMADTPTNRDMAALGVARISYGPGPYRQMIDALTGAARGVYEEKGETNAGN